MGMPGLAVAALVTPSWAPSPVEDVLDLVGMEKAWWYRGMRQELFIQAGEVSEGICQGRFALGL